MPETPKQRDERRAKAICWYGLAYPNKHWEPTYHPEQARAESIARAIAASDEAAGIGGADQSGGVVMAKPPIPDAVVEAVARIVAFTQNLSWRLDYDTATPQDKAHCKEMAAAAILAYRKAMSEQGVVECKWVYDKSRRTLVLKRIDVQQKPQYRAMLAAYEEQSDG